MVINIRISPDMLSITIPVFNEYKNIQPLYIKLVASLDKIGMPYEIIFINDGSSDGTEDELKNLAQSDERIKVITFRRNFGQTAAMMAGIDYASGSIIVPMDGDLQNDPSDIVRLIDKLNEGYDVVSGWRKDRKDNNLKRNIPSKMANNLISRISGVYLHDYGCSLKAYRKEVVKDIKLYGEMHRFIPIYAFWEGGKVTEISVTHHARTHGISKYGMERVFKVLLDLIVVKFLAKYANRPIYVFGGFGFIALFLSSLVSVSAIYLKLVHHVSFILTPLPLLAVTLFISGGMSILMGLLAEMVMRTYYESQGKSVYVVKDTLNFNKANH